MWDSFAFELIDEVELLNVLRACENFFARNLSRLDFVALYCQTKKTIPYGSEKSLLLEVGQKRSEWSVTSQTVTQLSFHCTCVSLHFSKRHPRVWIELRFKGFYHSDFWTKLFCWKTLVPQEFWSSPSWIRFICYFLHPEENVRVVYSPNQTFSK